MKTDVNHSSVQQNWTIKPIFTKSKTICLSSCNLNDACLNLVYNTQTSNCLLYTKHFQSNDLISSSCSDFYDKNSNL